MKKFKWLLGMLVLALMPMLQSCDVMMDILSEISVGTGLRSGLPVEEVIIW